MRKYRHQQLQSSPDGAEVWKERSRKYQQQQPEPETKPEQQPKSRKVPVVYYLCRSQQLQHPHVMEVSLVSPDGLYLRDVTGKFDALRGRGMASMYSWSCKRIYKNAFVWHDLCENDLVLPAHGNEYVLKGSELVKESNSGRFASAGNMKLQNLKQLPEPPSSITQDDCSSSTSMNKREIKHSQDEELSPHVHSSSSGLLAEYRGGKPSVQGGCLTLTEYKIYKSHGLADASTQTEEYVRVEKAQEPCTRSVSTDSGELESLTSDSCQNQAPCVKDNCDIQRDPLPPSLSSGCSSAGKTDTLESLIKADVNKLNSSGRLEDEEESQIPTNAKPRASNKLFQLISCGSISADNHNLGQTLSYKPRFLDSKFPSRLLPTSVMLGELDCLSENPRFMGMRLDDKEYFGGSLVETKLLKEKAITSLKRSSSYSANRINRNDPTQTRTKRILRSIKTSLSKQPRSASMRSSVSEGPRISYEGGGPNSRILSPCPSNCGSKRIVAPCPAKKQSKRMGSLSNDKENLIKIEERLASGARVIIHLGSTL